MWIECGNSFRNHLYPHKSDIHAQTPLCRDAAACSSSRSADTGDLSLPVVIDPSLQNLVPL